jgi:hypothetical protein
MPYQVHNYPTTNNNKNQSLIEMSNYQSVHEILINGKIYAKLQNVQQSIDSQVKQNELNLQPAPIG